MSSAPPPAMPRRSLLLVLHLVSFSALLLLLVAAPVRDHHGACDPRSLPDPRSLRPDQLTVLISGFSEARLPLLCSIVASYAAIPSVAAVLVLWGNPSTPSAALSPLLSAGPGVSVLRDGSPSLNARFLPRPVISTRAVAICDDDVEVHPRSLAFAFDVWRSRGEEAAVGFFARTHEFDLDRRGWIYAVHPERYSIVLTKFMILRTDYLHRYSCWDRLSDARRLVDRERNCEDILMNFVVAMESGVGPLLVDGSVRDWGDPRNSGNETDSGGASAGEGSADPVTGATKGREEVKRVGLSSRGDHRKRRGDCITEFHRMLGVMPLRYSYGKVVDKVGEQGLCHKGGKLVYCDEE